MTLSSNQIEFAILNLVYAFALTDGSIAKKEFDEIKFLLANKFWEYNLNQNQLELSFRDFYDKGISAESAFIEFKTFYMTNRSLFTKQIESDLYDSACQICECNNKKSKSELRLLANLDRLFKTEK
ncbi:MAG: hypothetical protein BM564_08580 [Bacteroidetes bacterium MedPE-SWsnd-G2]|nr:MAG: hypothetical protein BM564_08580 [Bacteroidetes bacterium MedPE-SWsnd-G2]